MSGAIGDRYRAVAERVAAAALRSGRRPEDVRVVVVGKTFAAESLAAAVAAGARDVGENYVQEAIAKREALRGLAEVRWHMIGRLQRNKARHAARIFDLIHSLDRVELARELDRAAAEASTPVRCLVEVNLGGERTKSGVGFASVERLLEGVATLRHVAVEGLMAIPPRLDDPDSSRKHFAFLRELGERLSRLRLPNVLFKELSMGMSGDFEVAVEEGATLVRVGTAIFGPRGAGR